MSQLDISIFYSHLFGLLLTFYIFSHFVVLILINYYYNNKIRGLELDVNSLNIQNINNVNTLIKILE